MHITGTHIAYLQTCARKLWLFASGVQMEHTSDIVSDGKLLHETTYTQRNEKHSELLLSADYKGIVLTAKLDFYNIANSIIHETKRSNKVEDAHIWQVKFYLWLLLLNGIENATGVIEYPLLRQTQKIELIGADIEILQKIIIKIRHLQQSENCPPVINAKICKSCSYFELCYINER